MLCLIDAQFYCRLLVCWLQGQVHEEIAAYVVPKAGPTKPASFYAVRRGGPAKASSLPRGVCCCRCFVRQVCGGHEHLIYRVRYDLAAPLPSFTSR